MSLKITNSEVDSVSVVELDGRIVLGEESNSLREKLKSMVAAGKKKIVLNVGNITIYRQHGARHIGRWASQRQNPGCLCAPLPAGQKIPRSHASNQAAHRFRRLRYTSGRSRQLPGCHGRRWLRYFSMEGHMGFGTPIQPANCAGLFLLQPPTVRSYHVGHALWAMMKRDRAKTGTLTQKRANLRSAGNDLEAQARLYFLNP